jgi:hypothetical protein
MFDFIVNNNYITTVETTKLELTTEISKWYFQKECIMNGMPLIIHVQRKRL